MLMPSFSACSSRNEPVPAAQASFMAKSTTTPFSMEMNLESWPPISKMVSTGSPPRVLLMWMAPVLCAVISSLTDVGAHELGDQLAARAGGAHAADLAGGCPTAVRTSASPCCTASMGRPAVRR